MTDRPIIFSGPMVRALMEGRKTQTRRLATSPLRKCRPGDRLYVRETWQKPLLCDVQYRATATERIGHWNPELGPWRPSIHMPRWASRITLVVTETRLQRLQDISEADAEAEGGEPLRSDRHGATEPGFEYRVGYARLWNTLHGPGSWEANPEIVAISFTSHLCNIDRMETADD